MNIEPEKREKIALEVIKVLRGRFSNFPQNALGNRNAPFHEAFLSAFVDKMPTNVDIPNLITLSSWLHGLNTTLGQSFFESIAHILSDGAKREFTTARSTQLYITLSQSAVVDSIMNGLQSNRRLPNLQQEDMDLSLDDGISDFPVNFTADNFVEEDSYIEAIELKSVRPNAGELRGEKRKVLQAKAALRRSYPNKEVRYFFGFPFDPWSNSPITHDKANFLRRIIEGMKYLDTEEVLLADELWNRLSGKENTLQQILDIINTIANPQFMEFYEFLVQPNYIDNDKNRLKYSHILEQWGLISEKKIVDNLEQIHSSANSRHLQRVFYRPIFNNNAEYNYNRYTTLSGLLQIVS